MILRDLQERLHAQNAHLELEFPFFLEKRALVFQKAGGDGTPSGLRAAMMGRV